MDGCWHRGRSCFGSGFQVIQPTVVWNRNQLRFRRSMLSSKRRTKISKTSTRALGTTTELVQDFEDLYQSLADFIRISGADGFTPEQAKVGGHALLSVNELAQQRCLHGGSRAGET